MKVLFIGDIFASAGRTIVKRLLPELIERHGLDLVLANGENIAGGNGVTAQTAEELLELPIGILTGGNHTWRFKEVAALLERRADRMLRPLNYPGETPGRGYGICETAEGTKVGVINLQGRVFMDPLPSPFTAADEAVAALREETPIIFVDFHAEATSEKRAMGWYLDGRVSAVLGTHTHVATADEEVLPQGTAYLTDLGMTGPYDSVIGMRKDRVLQRLLTMRPTSFDAAKHDARLCGAIVEVDERTGRARSIERVRERMG